MRKNLLQRSTASFSVSIIEEFYTLRYTLPSTAVFFASYTLEKALFFLASFAFVSHKRDEE